MKAIMPPLLIALARELNNIGIGSLYMFITLITLFTLEPTVVMWWLVATLAIIFLFEKR